MNILFAFIGLFVGSIIGYVIAYIQNKCENERRRRNNRFMDDKLKQALIQETERHIAQDILYDDVYVGPFTEKDGVDCAIHAVKWYRNHIWHEIKEKPAVCKFILLYDEKSGFFRPAGRFLFHTWPGYIEDLNTTYGVQFTKWAYMDDILPENASKIIF